jgi:hypothetical protein
MRDDIKENVMKQTKRMLGVSLIVFLAACVMAVMAVGCPEDEPNSLPPRNTGTNPNNNTGTNPDNNTGTNPSGQQTGTNPPGQQTGTNPPGQQTGTNPPSQETGGGGGEDGPGEPNAPETNPQFGQITYSHISVHEWQVNQGSIGSVSTGDEAVAQGYIEITYVDSGPATPDVVEVFGTIGEGTKGANYDGVVFEVRTTDNSDFMVALRQEGQVPAWRLMEGPFGSNGNWVMHKLPYVTTTAWGNIGGTMKQWMGGSFNKMLFIIPTGWGGMYNHPDHPRPCVIQLRNIGFFKGSKQNTTATEILWKPERTDTQGW